MSDPLKIILIPLERLSSILNVYSYTYIFPKLQESECSILPFPLIIQFLCFCKNLNWGQTYKFNTTVCILNVYDSDILRHHNKTRSNHYKQPT